MLLKIKNLAKGDVINIFFKHHSDDVIFSFLDLDLNLHCLSCYHLLEENEKIELISMEIFILKYPEKIHKHNSQTFHQSEKLFSVANQNSLILRKASTFSSFFQSMHEK